MEQKFQSAANIKDKMKLLESVDVKLTQQEIENIYKNIHNQGDNSYQLLEHALKQNFGGVLPKPGGNVNDAQFRKVSESTKDLDQISIYVNIIETQCKPDQIKPLYKQLGFQAERLIMEFRKQGNIFQKLHLDIQNLNHQSKVISMINKLCPKDLSFNPELFSLMLIPFKSLKEPESKHLKLLEQLADVLLQQCHGEGQANQNQVHDWLAILTGIIQHAYEGQSMGLFILLKKIPQPVLNELLLRHKNYMLFNYFNNAQVALKIFQGLTQYSINQEALFFISSVSQIIYNYVKEKKSKHYSLILQHLYKEFILTNILGNIQMIYCTNEIIDLLQIYIIGMSSVNPELLKDALELLCHRIQFLANIKFSSRDFITPRYYFLQNISRYYNYLQQNEQFLQIYNLCREKSTNEVNRLKDTYYQWDFQNLSDQQQIDQNLYEKDPKDFVGLENLTNTCFMNSILQSLYMTESFRKFILELQLTSQSLQVIPDTSSCLSSLQKLFMLLTYQKQGYCSPYELKRQLREPYSNTNDQQDVGEFAHHFLEDLLEIIPQKLQLTLENMFFGYQRSIIECFNCPKRQPNYGQKEKFLGIDLHFTEQENENEDLINMIRKAYEKEQIEFTCDKCKKKSDNIFKSQQLVQLPSVLFMTIHRFTYNLNLQTMTKMLTKVPFHFEIDMREVFGNKYLKPQDSIYYLYAFIVHLGKNSFSGHYICYARQLNQPDTWIAFDDTMITSQEINSQQLDELLIAEEAPYLLFYQNKSGKPLIFNN